MAIAFVQGTAAGNSGPASGGSPISLAGTVAGNTLVLIAARRGAAANTIGWPGGWTQRYDYDGAQASRSFGIRTMPSPGGLITAAFGATPPESSLLLEYSGLGPLLWPVVGTPNAAGDFVNTTTPSFPAITPPGGRGVLRLLVQWKQPATPNPGPITITGAGASLRSDTAFAGLGNRHRLTVWDVITGISSGGAVGPFATAGSSDGSEDGICAQVALMPVASQPGYPCGAW